MRAAVPETTEEAEGMQVKLSECLAFVFSMAVCVTAVVLLNPWR
jgi:hypothetical protein